LKPKNADSRYSDWAPRVAIARGIDGNGKNAAKTVRAPATACFYDRLAKVRSQYDRLKSITPAAIHSSPAQRMLPNRFLSNRAAP